MPRPEHSPLTVPGVVAVDGSASSLAAVDVAARAGLLPAAISTVARPANRSCADDPDPNREMPC